MSLTDAVRSKLDEYGIEIYSEYPMESDEHCMQTEDMMIFVQENGNSICISFRADLRPEDTSNHLLILDEIESLKDIKVMESYVFDQNYNFITGQDAFDYLKQDIISNAIYECAKQETYSKILQTTKCYNC
jgi:hypothetical protein